MATPSSNNHSAGRLSPDRASHASKGSNRQRFIKNNQYFTICIYGIVMVLLSAIIFKCIIDFDHTKAWFGQLFSMLTPFIIGALIAYVLNPMVRMFHRLIGRLFKRTRFREKDRMHTVLAILVTYVIVIGFVVLTLLFVVPEFTQNLIDFVNYIPTIYASITDILAELQERFPTLDVDAISRPLADLVPDIMSYLQRIATGMVPAIYTISMSIVTWLINLMITLIVSIYMLYDKHRLMRLSWKLIYAFLPEKYITPCHDILAECNRLFSSFVVGKFTDSLIIGFLCFVLMNILTLPYAPLISIIIGVTNMIPYFGPFIGSIPGVLIILFIHPFKALVFIIMIICLQQFDSLILEPKVLGNSIGMKPLWIIFAISIGGSAAGVAGMFLGVPVVSIISYLLGLYLEHRLQKKNVSDEMIDNRIKKMKEM